MTHPVPKEGHGDSYAAQLAASQKMFDDLQNMPPDEAKRVQEGSALVMSFGLGGAGETLLAKTGLGRAGAFLASEFAGGAIYGSVRPLEEDESRASAVLGDAASFAAFGGVLRGTGWALRRYISVMPRARRIAALRELSRRLDAVDSKLAEGGINLSQLPPDAAESLIEPELRASIVHVEPEIDLDKVISDQRAELGKVERPEGVPSDAALMQQEIEKLRTEEAKVAARRSRETITRVGEKEAEVTGPLPPEKPASAYPTSVSEVLAGGRRKYGMHTEESITPGEGITGIAVKGKSGQIYTGTRGETTHPDLMANLIEREGIKPEELALEGTHTGESHGYVTDRRKFVSKDEATRIGLEHATSIERVEAPVVRGHSGKLYVGEGSHPDIIESAIDRGVNEAEFRGIDADHPNRGFRTNRREFITREEAAKIVGHNEPRLFSEHLNARRTLAHESKETADQNITEIAADATLGAEPAAAMDAAVDQAVSRVKPEDVATPLVTASRDAAKQGELAVSTAGKEDAVAAAVRLERQSPEAATVALTGGEKPTVTVAPGEQVAAPFVAEAQSLINPKVVEGFEAGAHMTDEHLNALKETLKKEAGYIQGRLLLVITGSGLEAISAMYDKLSPSEKFGLRALGAFLLLAGLHETLSGYFAKNQIVRKFMLQYNPAKIMADEHHPELFRQYVEAMTSSRLDSTIFRDTIKKIFPKEVHEAAMFAAEEGPSAPEWHMLSPSQQRAALVLQQLELRRGMLLKAEGILTEYRDNYVRHLLPPESYQKWKTSGYKVLPVGGSFTQPRRIDTLRELIAWAKKEGVTGPVMDPAAVYSFHNHETNRALAVARLRTALTRQGMILDHDPQSAIPTGWRNISILGMTNKVAPEEIASALENISSPRASSIELVNSLDTIKGLWMRGIMMWPWEHGLNVLRSLPALTMNSTGFIDAWRAVKVRDPGLVEAATHGADMFSRPDYGFKSHEAWTKLTGLIGLPRVGAKMDVIQEKMDKWLWQQLVPSLQYFAYSTRMKDWAEVTRGRHLPSSPEYKVAARAAADFSNTVAGRIPQELAHPGLARLMRFALFSPQWTMTRMALIAHAAGELGEMASGKLNPRDAAYLPFKMRQLAWGIAITYVGSKILSGKEPAFSPDNSKFYMRTGSRAPGGREVGVDLVGWWQTDLQLFNHPFNFIFNRLNPALKVAQETIQGRDYLGRSMTTGQTINNIISSFGAGYEFLTEPAQIAARLSHGPPLTGGELLQHGSRLLATGNVAVLPRPLDAAIGRMAKKILIRQNIPANSDNIFQLSRLLRSNLTNGRDMVDDQVINWLSYYKRQNDLKNPISSAIGRGPAEDDVQPLWQYARRVLSEF